MGRVGLSGCRRRGLGLTLVAALLLSVPGNAQDRIELSVSGTDDALKETLRGASLLIAAKNDGVTDAQDLFATARAEYGRLLGALYAKGYYSGVIRISLDGLEAANIAPLDAPTSIKRIILSVDPGPAFTFSRAHAAPLAQGTTLPDGFAVGAPAESGVISEAASAAVDGWRALGHAKADVTSQDITADHKAAKLAADLQLTPGPRLRFGPLKVTGQERMRLNRIIKIAGLREGEVYDPQEVADAAERLRRTGVFRSVALEEDDAVTAPDLLGLTARLVEEKTRRYSYGAEIDSSEGAKLSGYWLHRNLFGGAERLKVEASIAQIGAADSGTDYSFGVTLDRPATLSRDTTGSLSFNLAKLDEADYTEDSLDLGLNFTNYFSETITLRLGLEYSYADVTDTTGQTTYRTLSLPVGALWDTRNSQTDATQGFYVDAEVKPFLGFDNTDSGARIEVDARTYYGFGENDRLTLAGRLQLGSVLGGSLTQTPRDFLFYSGGGGTVRGQPYQSLGITNTTTGLRTGGTSLAVASLELRASVTKSIGLVGFFDAGQITSAGFFGGTTQTHSGAGIGLRYATGFGPIRLDVGAPVSGNTGGGVQIYIGIGQAF